MHLTIQFIYVHSKTNFILIRKLEEKIAVLQLLSMQRQLQFFWNA